MDGPVQKYAAINMSDSIMRRAKQPAQCAVCKGRIGIGEWVHTVIRYDSMGEETKRTQKHLGCEVEV